MRLNPRRSSLAFPSLVVVAILERKPADSKWKSDFGDWRIFLSGAIHTYFLFYLFYFTFW